LGVVAGASYTTGGVMEGIRIDLASTVQRFEKLEKELQKMQDTLKLEDARSSDQYLGVPKFSFLC
jgi:hypothetical protein